jgi:xanthine dehydrogenase accessory factor
MRDAIGTRAGELRAARVPFVLARVVHADPPTSARPGDEAIVLADGTIIGFVGGTCAESTVRAQALALLDANETLLLRITPDETAAAGEASGRLVVHNPCLSGGALEIFLEPVTPAPLVAVVGESPIAHALAAIGERLGYTMVTWDGEVPDGAAAVVVASHGRDEEAALAAALRAGVGYVGLVASRKRGEAVVGSLDVCASMKARVHTPAGIDIGARTAEEIALSILADVVASRPRPSGRTPGADSSHDAVHEQHEAGAAASPTALDPVCGMTVAAVDASLHLDHDGRRWWFCGSGCLRAFAASPDAYVP